jgi:Sulfotransferase family
MARETPTAPIFIVGSERSGTTLLRCALNRHPRLAIADVAWCYPRFRRHLHTYGNLARPEALRTLVREMIFGLKHPFWGLPLNPRTVVDELCARVRAPRFAEVYRAMLTLYAEHAEKPRWGEKTPYNIFFVDEIVADFPDAMFLHIVRDGRDVAAEQLRSDFGPRTVYAAAQLWKQTVTAGDRGRAVAQHRWLDISYERLVSSPETEFEMLLTFLNERFDPAVLSPFGPEHPIATTFIGIHRAYLSSYDQGVFMGVADVTLRQHGYEVKERPILLDEAAVARELELDGRIRAATLDGPGGHIEYESYNDWLIEQREQRRLQGIWSGSSEMTWEDELRSGQRAPRRWKRHFGIRPRFD